MTKADHARCAREELSAFARLIKRVPLDDVQIEQGLVLRIADAIETLLAAQSVRDEGVVTYAEFQQRRGRLPDLIEEAIGIFDDWMKDDDYDTRGCLDRVIAKLETARDWYAPPKDAPTNTDAVERMREACAKVADEHARLDREAGFDGIEQDAIATAIRSLDTGGGA